MNCALHWYCTENPLTVFHHQRRPETRLERGQGSANTLCWVLQGHASPGPAPLPPRPGPILVKWKGYTFEESTWEPQENSKGSALQKYHTQIKEAKDEDSNSDGNRED